MLWRNSQLSIKLFEREPLQYRVLSKKNGTGSAQVTFLCIVVNLHPQAPTYTIY